MLCFDKLKVITSINYINEINKNEFQSISKNGLLQYYKYQQKTPYSLLIKVDYVHQELMIEFTSKILKDNCVKLISKNTIQECLSNINKLNICKLNIDIINNSEVAKCDVTQEINFHDIKELERYFKSNLVNYNKWICKRYKNGFVLENIAGVARYKKRLIVYCKGKELRKAENLPFLNSLSDKNRVLSYYDNNKIRFELNINTKKQIRQFLGIDNNQLMNVLNADANPILSLIDEAVKETKVNTHTNHTLKEYHYELTLKDCNYDLNQVEIKIRNLCSKNTSISKMMVPYKELYHRLNATTTAINIRELIA